VQNAKYQPFYYIRLPVLRPTTSSVKTETFSTVHKSTLLISSWLKHVIHHCQYITQWGTVESLLPLPIFQHSILLILQQYYLSHDERFGNTLQ